MKIGIINTIQPTTKATIDNTAKSVKKIKARKYPSWLGIPEDNFGKTVGYKIAFYPEDLAKMAKMTDEEVDAYKDKLLSAHKYYKDTTYRPLDEELKHFFEKYSINLNDFIVK